MSGGQLQSCGTAWEQGFRARLQRRNLDGISITRVFGNSEALGLPVSGHGPSQAIRVTQFPLGGLSHDSASRLIFQVATIRKPTRWARFIRSFQLEITL